MTLDHRLHNPGDYPRAAADVVAAVERTGVIDVSEGQHGFDMLDHTEDSRVG